MIFFPASIALTNKEWTIITFHYVSGWTEIPLSYDGSYDLTLLKFYDGFFGYLLKKAESLYKDDPEYVEEETSLKTWKYQGKLYRVLHKVEIDDDTTEEGYRLEFPVVEYHGMISHWTDDYTFSGLTYKLNPNDKYIILEADTGSHFGFDVNKYRNSLGVKNQYTEKEREIIFPMYKECIKEYHDISINEFIQMKENENKGQE